ncbi:MAG: S41 family peptidase [Defluviitaleaceae bacterium]|nr:S41 family peptidase [Defluviitaleaceae bacterium]MCL2240232.1 S41 family peptidase [Defluviitaleaceae bacterium]
MKMFEIKRALYFFFTRYQKTLCVSAIVVAVIATLAIVIVAPMLSRHRDEELARTAFQTRAYRLTRVYRLTRADFLYDFDYMISALEENFPSFGIVYRQHGVNMLEAAQDLRDGLECETIEIDFEFFWNMLRDEFFYHGSPGEIPLSTGHLFLISDGARRWLLSQYSRSIGWGASAYFVNILNSPPLYGGYPALMGDTHPLIRIPCWQPSRVLSTGIVKEGSIGYLRFYTFSRVFGSDDLEMLAVFYSEIADFEHLIIDLRGNTGGNYQRFIQNVTEFLINRPKSIHFYHFMMDGEHNMRFAQATGEFRRITYNPIQQIRFLDRDESFLFSRDSLFIGNNVSSYIIEDISGMDYYFIEAFTIVPRDDHYRSAFDGKKWLLIDEKVYSAAMYIASIHKNIGFATLVGETTGGGAVSPWHSNFITLPNTGIIVRYDPTLVIDRQGRPLEYGVEPHYFNRPGMDALETVLAMIAEGAY